MDGTFKLLGLVSTVAQILTGCLRAIKVAIFAVLRFIVFQKNMKNMGFLYSRAFLLCLGSRLCYWGAVEKEPFLLRRRNLPVELPVQSELRHNLRLFLPSPNIRTLAQNLYGDFSSQRWATQTAGLYLQGRLKQWLNNLFTCPRVLPVCSYQGAIFSLNVSSPSGLPLFEHLSAIFRSYKYKLHNTKTNGYILQLACSILSWIALHMDLGSHLSCLPLSPSSN